MNIFQVEISSKKRKILEIISEGISYKDKHFDIKLKPIFRTIVENQYIYN